MFAYKSQYIIHIHLWLPAWNTTILVQIKAVYILFDLNIYKYRYKNKSL